MINNTFRQGNIANVYIYTAVAVLILFISCVNYLLVSLGRASLRIREVGVRKVFGARRFDLLAQTLVEAIVVTVISLPIAVILVELFLRDLSALLGTTIADSYFHNVGFVGAFFLVALFIGLVSGSYIADRQKRRTLVGRPDWSTESEGANTSFPTGDLPDQPMVEAIRVSCRNRGA